jgi:hypothetical protein
MQGQTPKPPLLIASPPRRATVCRAMLRTTGFLNPVSLWRHDAASPAGPGST